MRKTHQRFHVFFGRNSKNKKIELMHIKTLSREGNMSKQAKTLTAAELRRALDYVATRRHAARNRAMLMSMYLAGLRVGECAALMQLDPSLALWVDRNVSDVGKDATALCSSAMPRCVTSRSVDKASGDLQSAVQRKNDVKIAVVERALERCG